MIALEKGSEPQVLLDNDAAWTAEYVKWCENQVGTEPRRYAHEDIRSALRSETNWKCAYCEGRISDIAFDHIEHKLPKRKNPGLVCDWMNLTIACPVCNTLKSDYNEPACPLLDPYSDDVENLVEFGGPMAFGRGGARSHATVRVLGLNRAPLLYSRKETLERLDGLLDRLEIAANQPDVVIALWFDIKELVSAEAEYASACRYFLAWQMEERGLARP